MKPPGSEWRRDKGEKERWGAARWKVLLFAKLSLVDYFSNIFNCILLLYACICTQSGCIFIDYNDIYCDCPAGFTRGEYREQAAREIDKCLSEKFDLPFLRG